MNNFNGFKFLIPTSILTILIFGSIFVGTEKYFFDKKFKEVGTLGRDYQHHVFVLQRNMEPLIRNLGAYINNHPAYDERLPRIRNELNEMNVQRLHENVLTELRNALQDVPKDDEVTIMIDQIDGIQEYLANFVQEYLRVQRYIQEFARRYNVNVGLSNNPIINSLGNNVRRDLLMYNFMDENCDLQNITQDELNEIIGRIKGATSGDEAFNDTALRLLIANETWNNGRGYILREDAYSANVDLSWRAERHYQNGVDGEIRQPLRDAINNAFGDVSFSETIQGLQGRPLDLVLGRNFASYLHNVYNENGHGPYDNRYAEIPQEERALFENIVYLMQGNQHRELRNDLRAIALNRRNQCPNEALGLIRQMILRTDTYFMNLNGKNLGENYLSYVVNQVLMNLRMSVFEQVCFNLPGVRDAGIQGFGAENLRGYKFKLTPGLNMPPNMDRGAAGYVRGTTYGEVANAIAPYLKLKFISENAEPILSGLEENQKKELEDDASDFNISFYDFNRIISEEEELIEDARENLENARENYENARENYENARENYENARENYENARENYENAKNGKFSLLNRLNEFLNDTKGENDNEANQARQKIIDWTNGRINITYGELRDSLYNLDLWFKYREGLRDISPEDLENEQDGPRYLAHTLFRLYLFKIGILY